MLGYVAGAITTRDVVPTTSRYNQRVRGPELIIELYYPVHHITPEIGYAVGTANQWYHYSVTSQERRNQSLVQFLVPVPLRDVVPTTSRYRGPFVYAPNILVATLCVATSMT